MKKVLVPVFLFFLSCSQQSENNFNSDIMSDTLLINSQKNLEKADTVYQKSDSLTVGKVNNIIKEIIYLNHEVEKFRTEKLTLEKQLMVTSEKVIYRIDTVFIETQKNFWGKTKTKTSVNSDSTVVELLDSLQTNLEKIDTLKLNQYL